MQPKELANLILQGDFETVYSQTDNEFKAEISLEELREIAEDFTKDIMDLELQSELINNNDGSNLCVWLDDSGTKGIVAVFNSGDVIEGIQFLPVESYPETDEVFTKTKFIPPFKGEWLVAWGGINSLVNYHYEYESQRYAYDFIVVKDNKSYEGDKELNESYHAFGKECIAPADGVVVEIENNIKDNEPVGIHNTDHPAGNYVTLDHGNDEFSHISHFKYQSIVVKEGDTVKRGDLLGLVGNSGNSSEAHIHFHVANSSDLWDSKSIRINFDGDSDMLQGNIITQ